MTRLPSCHEFSVSDVKIDYNKVDYHSNAECEVTLVAGKFGTNGSLYGPASRFRDRTIISAGWIVHTICADELAAFAKELLKIKPVEIVQSADLTVKTILSFTVPHT